MLIPSVIVVFGSLSVIAQESSTRCNDLHLQTYKVRKFDCLFNIAKAFQVTVDDFLDVNSMIPNATYIQLGWLLCVPQGGQMIAPPDECPNFTFLPEETDDPVEPERRQSRTSQSTDSELDDNSLQNVPSPTVVSREESRTAVDRNAPSRHKLKEQSQITSLAPGSVDQNIVQCQFLNSGFLKCFQLCTVDLYEYRVEPTSNSRIMMRQCVENGVPVFHTWQSDDGILPPWIEVELIPTGQPEKIVAACTFSKDRRFNCRSSYMCSSADGMTSSCDGGLEWNGKTTEGDPLGEGKVMRGIITTNLKAPSVMGIRRRRVGQRQKRDGADDDRIIQCLYYTDFQLTCQGECSIDPTRHKLDATDQEYMLHDCKGENISHPWHEADGVLDMSEVPKRREKAHELVAMCAIQTSNIFECSGLAICDNTRKNFDMCSGGLPWRGIIKGGDPLKDGDRILGEITAHAQNSGGPGMEPTVETAATNALSPPAQVPHKPKPGGLIARKPTVSTNYTICFLQNQGSSPSSSIGCVSTTNENRGIRRLTTPFVRALSNTPIADKQVSALFKDHKRTVCIVPQNMPFYCKGHSETDCYMDGEPGEQTQYAKCQLAAVWQSRWKDRQNEQLQRSCVMLRSSTSQKFESETCFYPNAKLWKDFVRRENKNDVIQALIAKYNLRNLLRLECDYFDSSMYCVGYSQNHCTDMWNQDTNSMYFDCGASYFCSDSDDFCKTLARVDAAFS